MDGIIWRHFLSKLQILKSGGGRGVSAIAHVPCRSAKRWAFWMATLLLLSVMTIADTAQTSTGTLRGRITDPTGAVITQATVLAATADGRSVTVVTNNQGIYEFKGLAAGSYTVTAVAKGFATDQEEGVNVVAGQTQQLDIALQIAVEQQHVEVQEEAPTIGVSAENSASTLIIKGKDLEALSDDPDELQSELQALAGPSAGPNGGQIYVDGFTAGQLPPKSAIREIRINQNPFSAQYDQLGYGRIEIFTKPGTDQMHGQVMVNGNTSAFNALNPFVTEEPGYYSEIFNGNISGPLERRLRISSPFNRETLTTNLWSPLKSSVQRTISFRITRRSQALRRCSTSARASISSSLPVTY